MSVRPDLVGNRYQLREPLGVGGMGRVWRAWDESLGRDVAIKLIQLPAELIEHNRDVATERALREARAAARLNHPNVVRVYDVLKSDGQPWLVMEYVASRSLHEVVTQDGPVSPRRAAHIGLEVLSALRAAHRAGVQHRDIKPSNVLLTTDGRVVLTDFGIATIEGDTYTTRTGLVLGSPEYIAPERAKSGISGSTADLWSLGATLYFAVEGRSPFQRNSAIETLSALATEDPDPITRGGPLAPVLHALLRKDPDVRANFTEAERLLRSATVARETRPQPAARVPKPRRWWHLGSPGQGTPAASPGAAESGAGPASPGAGGSSTPVGSPGAAAAAASSGPPAAVPAPPAPPAPLPAPRASGRSPVAPAARPVASATVYGTAVPVRTEPEPDVESAPAVADVESAPAVADVESAPVAGAVSVDSSSEGSSVVEVASVSPAEAPPTPTTDAEPAQAEISKTLVDAPPVAAEPDVEESTAQQPVDDHVAAEESADALAAEPIPVTVAKPPAPVDEPVAESVHAPVAEPAAESVRAPFAEPAAESAHAPVAEPAAEAPSTPVAESAPVPVATSSGPPAGAPAAAQPSRRRVVVGAIAAVVVIAIVVTIVLVANRSSKPDRLATTPTKPTTSLATSPAANPPATTGAPSAAATTAQPATPTAQGPTLPALPAGWVDYHDPTGFSVYVPANWRRSKEGSIMYFRGDGRVLGVDQTNKPHMDPVADWKNQSAYRVSHGDFPNYQEIKIAHVNYFITAADWEFTFDRGGRQHVNNRGVVVSNHQAYGFYWQTADSQWTAARPDLQLVFDSFRPAR